MPARRAPREQEQQERHAPAISRRRHRRERADTRRPGSPVDRLAQCVDELGGGGEAVSWLLREAAREHVVELPWQLRIRVRRRRDRGADVRDRLRRGGLALERALAGQELERDHREGVDVACRGGPLAARLLRRQVPGGADDGTRLGEGGEVGGARDAEVGDLDAVVVVQEQVRRLHVPVDDPVGVRGVERRRRLAEPLEGAAHRLYALSLEPVCERAAGEILHHDVGAAAVLADVEDRDRARRVREACNGERLAGEAAADRVVVGEAAREQLDRDDARQIGVLGPVDLTHAAPRDQLGVAVAGGKVALVHPDDVPQSPLLKTPGNAPVRVEGSVKNPWNHRWFS